MNLRRLSFASIVVICSVMFLFSHAISGEYRNQSFPSDEVIKAQAWQHPNCKPIRILGKQKISDNEYRLLFATRSEISQMAVIKLDTNVWIHIGAKGLENGLFAEFKH